MTALDRVEFAGEAEEKVIEELIRTRGVFDTDEPPAHAGLVSWSVEAFRNYRAAWKAHQSAVTTPCPRPVRSEWVVAHDREQPDHRGVVRYVQTCWGRRYRSEDGSLREIWLLGFTTPAERPSVVYSTAANVAAFGRPGRPERVRTVVFGAMSPVAARNPEWTVEQVRLRARQEVAPRLVEVVDGTERRAGGDCAQCSLALGCSALHSADLLPDVPAPGGARRELSVTDLRRYRCPARYHLVTQLHIRDPDIVESQPILVGRAVDATLRERHAPGSPRRRCTADQSVGSAVSQLSEEGRRTAGLMLAQHSATCPFPDVDDDGSEPRQLVVVNDERLGVVFIAAPDLVYSRQGGWVWRETKTSSYRLRRDLSLLRQVPQLALAVLMVASGVLGGDVARSRVEFEQLRPDGAAREELDPGLPSVVAEAREVIGDLVRPLLTDTTFEPVPGRDCAGCEVRRWCAVGTKHVAEQNGAPTS